MPTDDRIVPVAEHLARVLDPVGPLPARWVPLLAAQDCVLAEDVRATAPLPGFDNSAMDGYAVRVADVAAAPVSLPVVADLPAGAAAEVTLPPGAVARIMTGARLPVGTEAIVPVEDTDGGLTEVLVRAPAVAGRHLRHTGEDVRPGDLLIAAGTRLGPLQLGLLAATGHDRAPVRPRPRVVVLSTGSELVPPGTERTGSMIFESNSYLLTAAVLAAGGVVVDSAVVSDDPGELLPAIESRLAGADLVITSGGVSMGAYDVVKEVLAPLGTVGFTRVAMQPGKPQGFGHLGPARTPIFTLPGNPVSAYVSFEVFVRPVLRRMLGAEPLERPVTPARCRTAFRSPPGRRQYARATYELVGGEPVVDALEGQGSHRIATLARSNALIVVPEDVTAVAAGSMVDVLVL